MVEFKKLDPKELANEISKKVQDNEATQDDVAQLLLRIKEDMPEDFHREVEKNLRELMEEVKELREVLKDRESTGGTGSGESTGSWLSFGIFRKLDIFSKFVSILKEGGPYSIIAILILSNVWMLLELQKANDRIINLLITLQATGRPHIIGAEPVVPANRPIPGSLGHNSSPDPESGLNLPEMQSQFLDDLELPPEVIDSVRQISEDYQEQVQLQMPNGRH